MNEEFMEDPGTWLARRGAEEKDFLMQWPLLIALYYGWRSAFIGGIIGPGDFKSMQEKASPH